jgi:hypothetical protein
MSKKHDQSATGLNVKEQIVRLETNEKEEFVHSPKDVTEVSGSYVGITKVSQEREFEEEDEADEDEECFVRV